MAKTFKELALIAASRRWEYLIENAVQGDWKSAWKRSVAIGETMALRRKLAGRADIKATAPRPFSKRRMRAEEVRKHMINMATEA